MDKVLLRLSFAVAGLFLAALIIVPFINASAGIPATAAPQQDASQPFRIQPGEYLGGTVQVDDKKRPVKEFTMYITEKQHELKKGVTVTAWAFGLEGQEATVPGPELKVEQGDLVRITVKNTHNRPHTIHFHGLTSLSQDMDGVPSTSFPILPGQQYTYEFVAKEPGVIMYHCHVQTYLHMDHGMYGSLIVEPKEPIAEHDLEYSLILDEWDSRQDQGTGNHDPDPNYFLINGKAYPDTKPLEIPEGKVALVNLMNAGYSWHAMHLHGTSFYVVTKDGYPVPQPYKGDTLSIGPGERYGILIKGRDGTFPFHDHALKAVTNDGVYPGGMLLLVKGSAPRDIHGNRGEHTHKTVPISDNRVEPAPVPETSKAAETQENVAEASAPANHREETTGEAASGEAASPDVTAQAVVVSIANFQFAEATLTIKAGTTVTWTNNDTIGHTVNEGEPGGTSQFESGLIQPGKSWSYTFTQSGEYDYYCQPHPFMKGKVVVQ